MVRKQVPQIETARLLLRGFTDADHGAYAAMRADPDVVRFLPGGEALVPFADEIATSRIKAFRDGWSRGFGVWAIEARDTGGFIGYAGLAKMERSADVEVLYGLTRAAWGRGYAREAAGAALTFAFDVLGLARVVAFVMPENGASVEVLEAIGMRRIGETTYNDFPVIGYAINAGDGPMDEEGPGTPPT